MKEKNIKRIIKKQVKSNHPNWQRIPRKRKKEIIKEITDAVVADYQVFDEELGIPIEELIGIEQQQPDSRVLTDEGHEYKCAADAGECSRSAICPQFRLIAFDDGHFQRMVVDGESARQAIEMRKNCERPFNLMKKREGLENAVVRSLHALCGRMTFTMITTLLIEMAGFRKKEPKGGSQQLELFNKAA